MLLLLLLILWLPYAYPQAPHTSALPLYFAHAKGTKRVQTAFNSRLYRGSCAQQAPSEVLHRGRDNVYTKLVRVHCMMQCLHWQASISATVLWEIGQALVLTIGHGSAA